MEKNGRWVRPSVGRRLGACVLTVALMLSLSSCGTAQPAGVSPEPSSASLEVRPEPSEPELTREEKLAVIECGKDYPPKLVQMARSNAEAVDFVYEYPQRKGKRAPINLRDELKGEGVPLLMQWDERWGYQEYGDGPMGYTGCGPTCLSMASLYLTGRDTWNPSRVADMAVREGYMLKKHGSSWKLISEGCKQVGLRAEALPLVCGTMVDRLDRGQLIILALGPGDFTGSGHFVLVTGYEEDGFRIHDPNRRSNSEKLWGFSQLKGQIRNLWAMSPA